MEPQFGGEPEQQIIAQYEDMEYESEEEQQTDNDDRSLTVVKRGITRLHKFRNEHGKGVKIGLLIDEMGRISGSNRVVFASFLGDLVRERIGLKVLSWKKVLLPARDDLWTEIKVCRKHFQHLGLFNIFLMHFYLHYVQLLTSNLLILQRYFDIDDTYRKLIMQRLGALLKNYRRKLRERYILPDKDTPDIPKPTHLVPAKYTAILEASDWANFVEHTNSEAYKVYIFSINLFMYIRST